MIILADLHLKESTEDQVWAVLAEVRRLALEDPDHHVVFCGDWWQLRYQVNVRLLNKCKAILLEWVEAGLQVDLVPGNHDQVTIDGVNALEVLEDGGPRGGVRVWTGPGVAGDDYRKVGFCPYRKDPQEQLRALELASKGACVVFGHFGVKGSQMDNTRQDQDGLVVVPGGPLLILGHYHRHQQGMGYVYVGSPYQQSFGEVGNAPGVLQLHVDPGAGPRSRRTMPWKHVPLDIGPRYWILPWDLDASANPPARPSTWRLGDQVRIDVKAAYSQLANPKLLTGLADVGLGEAVVNILPREDKREGRLPMVAGESLGQSAERFARERVADPQDLEARLTYLRRWAGEEVGS
jgi:DNA repair exonuclease SbcCD nuclease subunit